MQVEHAGQAAGPQPGVRAARGVVGPCEQRRQAAAAGRGAARGSRGLAGTRRDTRVRSGGALLSTHGGGRLFIGLARC